MAEANVILSVAEFGAVVVAVVIVMPVSEVAVVVAKVPAVVVRLIVAVTVLLVVLVAAFGTHCANFFVGSKHCS